MFTIDLGLEQYAPGGAEITAETISAIGETRGFQVLEVGASAGFCSFRLAKKYNLPVIATDINPLWVSVLDERIKKQKLGRLVKTRREDVLKLSFRKGTFNLALANGVLYFTDKAGALREINRVLKKGGFVSLGEPLWLTKDPPYNLSRVLEVGGAEIVTAEKYQLLFKENGFEMVSFKKHPSVIWEDYYAPLQAKLTQWKKTNSPFLTKYSTEIDLVIEEITQVRALGPANLAYGLMVGKKTAEATIELL